MKNKVTNNKQVRNNLTTKTPFKTPFLKQFNNLEKTFLSVFFRIENLLVIAQSDSSVFINDE
jgi:hypothetical protein